MRVNVLRNASGVSIWLDSDSATTGSIRIAQGTTYGDAISGALDALREAMDAVRAIMPSSGERETWRIGTNDIGELKIGE